MERAFKTVALIGKYNGADIAEPILNLAQFLSRRNVEVILDGRTAAYLHAPSYEALTPEEIGRRADLAVIIGGDGTVLNAARELAPYGVPLAGVNQGRLGFMTDIPLENMLEGVAALLDGEYSAEERMMLNARLTRHGKVQSEALSFNDVVVSRGAMGRMIEFSVHIDGQFVYNQRSDGIILATPTGSTAYALSAGGPILQPGVSGFALVPICPHALSNRPIVVKDRSVVEIVMIHALYSYAYLDGQNHTNLQVGDRITVKRHGHNVRLLHPAGYNYYAMLREKLHWSESAY